MPLAADSMRVDRELVFSDGPSCTLQGPEALCFRAFCLLWPGPTMDPPDSADRASRSPCCCQLPVRKCVRLRHDDEYHHDSVAPFVGTDGRPGVPNDWPRCQRRRRHHRHRGVGGHNHLSRRGRDRPTRPALSRGSGAGVILYQSAFGFTSAWRSAITVGRGDGLRAQLLMLSVTCAVFFPLIARGELLGQTLRGSVSPAGIGVIVGAFLFGVGMQLGGGSPSGHSMPSAVATRACW